MNFAKKQLFILFLIVGFCLTSCGSVENSPGGVRVTPEMLESVSLSLVEDTATKSTSSTERTETQTTTTVKETTVKDVPNENTSTVKSSQKETTVFETTTTTTTVTAEIFSTSLTSVAFETTVATSTQTSSIEEAVTITTSVENSMPEVVYWTEGGGVYHLTDQCSTLRRSKNILHGSVDEALAAKKERPCKTCS